MDFLSQAQRRKACDLCFTKKIKCDMLKPACSNCLLYKSECRTTMVRRRAPPMREKIQPPKPAEEPSRVAELESRLAIMEAQLQQVLEANQSRNQLPSEHALPSSESDDATFGSLADRGSASDTMEYLNSLSNSDESPDGWVLESNQPRLPPLEEVLPAVELYFLRFNEAIPLFHQASFMRVLSDWYSPSSERPVAVWAAVNTVLAIAHRCGLDDLNDDQMVSQYMRNAQSVISELVTRDSDLLGLQVLLGMVFLFQGTKDSKPASVFIGTAVRLAHRLQLHDKDSSQDLAPEIVLQRSRLFWIAYFLDKNISMRSKTPSFQLDVDIDLPLPESEPEDDVGVMFAKDGTVKFNYFRTRVALSHIEGKVYDLLYSTRARKVSVQERQLRVVRLDSMLDQWRRSIPPDFTMESVVYTLAPVSLAHVTMLYHNYLVALMMIHGIYSHDTDWVTRISVYGRTSIEDFDGDSTGTSKKPQPPLPSGWAKCVEISRASMKLFKATPKNNCSVWSNACAHFSALIIVLANILVFPDHEDLDLDRQLAYSAMEIFEILKAISQDEAFHRLHAVVSELYRHAMLTIESTAEKNQQQAAAAAEANTILTFGVQLDDDIELFQNEAHRLFDRPQAEMRHDIFKHGAIEEQHSFPDMDTEFAMPLNFS